MSAVGSIAFLHVNYDTNPISRCQPLAGIGVRAIMALFDHNGTEGEGETIACP